VAAQPPSLRSVEDGGDVDPDKGITGTKMGTLPDRVPILSRRRPSTDAPADGGLETADKRSVYVEPANMRLAAALRGRPRLA